MARTRAEDFEDKQRNILISAAAVFAEQGMEKASMSAIASESGVSKSLLYHYYPNKDALIFAIIRSHLEELDMDIEAADVTGAEPEVRLKGLVRAVLENYRDADNQHKVQLNAGPMLSEEQKSEIHALERKIVRRFSAILDEINPNLQTGEKPLLMPVTMSLFGMMNWVYMWFREGGPVTRQDYADVATTLILEGVKAVKS
ncbi:TetR family transcriptional regulator [Roseibium hamelinense]|uniref:TetR family transcriptional regulator n=1 Tax=Roseibium hamelinense TaxID=150831 RepID=A0A562TIE0_9HYPH|nr:TetR/AcrR family transcriptional regulator [Roseibium hamelinense]MTI45878.1 TetR/AcrR family transcriptional regulator [Roseibium hamelinense]TWI92938.1 TetR family transcriptional regulator [Roseibium hamelinense]